MIDVETQELERNRAHIRVAVFAGIARRRVMRQRRAIALVAGAALMVVCGTAVGASKLTIQPDGITETTGSCFASEDLYEEPLIFQSPPEVWSRDWVVGNCAQILELPESAFGVCISPQQLVSAIPRRGDESDAELCARLGLPEWDGR